MSPVPQSVKSNLLSAFRHLLKPLVRLAIKNEVTLREFGEALKSAYVGVASKQIGMSGGDPTAEAIAVLLNGNPVQVTYVGSAPGMVEGVMQINFVVPQVVDTGPVMLTVSVGAATSQSGVTVRVQ